MPRDARIFVAGHRGLAGSAIVRRLEREGYTDILTRTRDELDLTDQAATRTFFEAERPHYVFGAAAKVGGILANDTYPAEFLYDNLMIEVNMIDACYRSGVEKLVFLGSTCIYPKLADQPIREESLLTGPLEPTNEAYAIAKIAGLKMCEAYRRQYGFRTVVMMPTNLYGPGDNFDLEKSHVLPALIRKAHEAKVAERSVMEVWGTGDPYREFLHVDDMADAALFCMTDVEDYVMVNVGSGQEISIRELAELVREVVGFQGEIRFDPSKPDGTPRKICDTSRLNGMGWQARISLRQGIADTYAWYLEADDAVRGVTRDAVSTPV